MIRSDHFCTRRSLICLWILILLHTVAECRRYDKCTTGDGRQGVCVVKRYCREGSQHEILPCERDEEHHCCPIPTTQRSAPTLPPSVFERPREEDQRRPEPEVKRTNTDVFREQGRDDQLNKTPAQEERRQPDAYSYDQPKRYPTVIDKPEEFDSERRRPYKYPENLGIYIERPRHTPQSRPVASQNEQEFPRIDYGIQQSRRDHGIQQPSRDHGVQQPSRDHGVQQPSRDHGIRQPEREHGIRQPERDPPVRQPDRDQGVRQPNRDHVVRQPNREHVVRQPERSDPVRQPNKDQGVRQTIVNHGVRQPDRNRFYPPKDITESPRILSPPRWNFYEKVPERKNRTIDDSSKLPITFPEPYVPIPKVPACGVKPYDLFIAGGQESAEHEWPWMTAIFRRYPDSRPKTFLCGGSLINTKYVLTAAHCFVNNYVILPASSFVVRLGSHYLDSGEEYTVANLVIHHNHSGSDFFNDIALVRLASEVYITDKIAPICLPSPDMMHQSLVGRLATVAGWGDTAFRTSGTRILQHVTVPVVSGEECFAAYSRVRGAAFLARGSDHVICAGLREGGKDACLGDSGGPLMLRMPSDQWIIVGIVSLGYKCAEPGYPGVYTRVTHYMSWINTNMKRY